MSGFTVQIILFSFSVILFILGIYLTIKAKQTVIKTVFTAGIILAIVAALDPYTISKIAVGKWLNIERYQPSKEERESVLKLATDTPTTISPEEKEKLVIDATLRPDQKRSPEDYLVLATEAWRAKKYDDALRFTFTGLNLKPEDSRVKATLINRIGSVYSSLKIPDLAIKYYKEAMEEDPEYSWPHYNLGNLFVKQEKYTEAEQEYKKAIELDPEDASPHYNLGNLYKNQERNTEAEDEYKKAIELYPELALPHNNLGILYSDQKKYAEAEKEYKKAIELDPEFADPHNNLGNVYSGQRKYSEAEEEYKRAIELDPEYATTHNNLGALYQAQEKYVDAEKEYKKAIEIDPNLEATRKNLKTLQAFIKTD